MLVSVTEPEPYFRVLIIRPIVGLGLGSSRLFTHVSSSSLTSGLSVDAVHSVQCPTSCDYLGVIDVLSTVTTFAAVSPH